MPSHISLLRLRFTLLMIIGLFGGVSEGERSLTCWVTANRAEPLHYAHHVMCVSYLPGQKECQESLKLLVILVLYLACTFTNRTLLFFWCIHSKVSQQDGLSCH